MIYSDYDVIRQQSLKDLTEMVKDSMRHGWQPIGGVYQSQDGTYLQAMAVLDKAHLARLVRGGGEAK